MAYLPTGNGPEAMRRAYRVRLAADGTPQIHIGGSPEDRYWEAPWFVRVRQGGKAVWQEPYFETPQSNILLTSCHVPFYRTVAGVRRFAGVVSIDLDLRKFRSMLSPKVVADGYNALISRNGLFFTVSAIKIAIVWLFER